MNIFQNKPIGTRLQRAIMLTSTFVVLLTCLSFVIYEYYAFRHNTITNINTMGEIIASNATAAMAFEDKDDATEILNALKAEKQILAARLYDRAGNVFSQYPEDLPLDTVRCRDVTWGYHFVGDHMEGYHRVKKDDNFIGTLYIKSNLQAMGGRFQLYGLIVLLIIIFAVFISIFLGRILQKTISHPLRSLSATATAIANRQDYTLRAEKPDDYELGALSVAFNHMLGQIESRDEALSNFSKQLEAKVEARTSKLEEANREQLIAQQKIHQKNLQLEDALNELQVRDQKLQELNAHLEQRVQERTNALKVSEDQLRLKNAELERTIVDLDNFVYRASHDLKSPISNIQGLIVLFHRQLKGRLDEEELKMLEMIERSLAKFTATISDLTEISKVQKGYDLPDELVLFEEVLDEVKEDIWQLISSSGVEIQTDFKVREVRYAPSNLRSIIYNLVSNSIKYRSADRPLKIEISTFTENDRIVLTVKDNGLGINPEDLGKIFTMFKRMHAHVEGSGIGLYITKRIIENSGGTISVSSTVDEGTFFKVVL